MTLIIGVATISFFTLLIAALGQVWRYYRSRRDIAMDRQALFHDANVVHVVTALKLGPDQALLPAMRHFVEVVEGMGARVVYAGKSVVTGTQSSQVPNKDWDAFVVSQYRNREAFDGVASDPAYKDLQATFGNSWSIGMARNAVQNLVLPLYLLALRARQIITREAPRFPFVEHPDPVVFRRAGDVDRETQKKFLAHVVSENEQFSKDGLVVVNFQKDGNAKQVKADSSYTREIMSLMAEVGHGPLHIGRAISLQDQVDFDRVVLVYYPGVKYFIDMLQSTYYTSIFGNKQLGDNLSFPTVPILDRL